MKNNDYSRGTVGFTSSLGFVHEMPFWTNTSSASSERLDETERALRTVATIDHRLPVFAQRRKLSVGVHHLHVHGAVYERADVGSLQSVELVSALDRLVLPIRPVDVLLEDTQREDVEEGVANDVAHVATVEVGEGNVIETCVSPDDALCDVIEREGVRPTEMLTYDRLHLTSVHSHSTCSDVT